LVPPGGWSTLAPEIVGTVMVDAAGTVLVGCGCEHARRVTDRRL